MYIEGGSLIAKVSLPEERGRVQGFVDLVLTSTIAASSLTAGALHSQIGWKAMTFAAIMPTLIVAIGLVWLPVNLWRTKNES